ncbi:MAG TPA: S-layer homology domain-containing protein [Chloroflexia bacterium]|nr:S-layer homology domain-containing protein [Chloroflexia bacterium]
MSRALPIAAAFVAAVTAFVALSLFSVFASASAPVSAPALPKVLPTAIANGPSGVSECGPPWQVVASPELTSTAELHDVVALSDNDVWAVGFSPNGHSSTLVEHWDGSMWSVVPSPNPGSRSNELYSIDGVSDTDLWAVGNTSTETAQVTLVEHWDGSMWSVVPSPNLGADPNFLKGVTALSSSNVWAVGNSINGTAQPTLIEHWNGSSWSIVRSPNVGTGETYLDGVTAVTSSDMWAVGHSSEGGLIDHWNGTEWSVSQSPGIGRLYGVAAISSSDVWAVGSNDLGSSTLTEHWDGHNWTVIPSPDVDQSNILYDISAISSNDVWAMGVHYYVYLGDFPGSEIHPLFEHWDGTAWSVMPSADTLSHEDIYGVAAVSSTDIWVVGNIWNDTTSTLIEHYNGVPCPPTLTPTPIPTPRCPGERFTDVCPGDYFYQHVLDLNDLGIIAGYNTAPPCDGPAHIPCFKPGNWSTRGQIAKIVSLAAGFNEDVTGQTFEDVPPDHTFYQYIERMASRGIINGYPCGGPDEPCNANNDPYFRPGNTVSRGQLTKMVSIAFDFNEPVGDQAFEDVRPGQTFYDYVQRLAARDIISGYPCGIVQDPCSPRFLPYFHPAENITRGQIAKVVNLARTQTIPTPGATATGSPAPTGTPDTPTAIATGTAAATSTVTPTTTSTPTSTP